VCSLLHDAQPRRGQWNRSHTGRVGIPWRGCDSNMHAVCQPGVRRSAASSPPVTVSFPPDNRKPAHLIHKPSRDAGQVGPVGVGLVRVPSRVRPGELPRAGAGQVTAGGRLPAARPGPAQPRPSTTPWRNSLIRVNPGMWSTTAVHATPAASRARGVPDAVVDAEASPREWPWRTRLNETPPRERPWRTRLSETSW
jgi:hypothetical protein